MQLAAIQKEAAGFEGAEIQGGQGSDGGVERLGIDAILDAGQGEVRRVGAGFGGDAEG
jgi:hypothetical protein